MPLLAKFVMHRTFNAILLGGLLGGLSMQVLPLAILSAAIAGLILLRKGTGQGLVVFIGIALIVVIYSHFIEPRPGLEFPLVIALMVPVWLSAQTLRTTESQGTAVAVAVACAAVFAIAVQVQSGDAIAWWSEWLRLAITGVKNSTFQGFEDSGSLKIMNGIVAMMLAFATIGSLMVARWMQAGLYMPGGFKKEFHHLQVPRLVFFLVVIVLAVLLALHENLFTDLFIVFTVIYFIQGLSVLHCNVDRLGRSSAYLLPPYLLIVWIPHYVIVGMAGVGLVDNFINFRKLPGKNHDSN